MTRTKVVEHVVDPHPLIPKWGVASDKRGVAHRKAAMDFVKAHPIGTVMSAEDFDLWLHKKALLVIPPADAPRSSDAWLGHLQRRHIVRGRINKAATHPRLAENGHTPFFIAAMAGGFEVRAPHVEARQQQIARQITHLTQTKRKQLAYLLQSADFDNLPMHERVLAEQLFDDIGGFARQVTLGAELITERLDRLQLNLTKAIESGTVKPANGGLKQLLAPPSAENSDDDNHDDDT